MSKPFNSLDHFRPIPDDPEGGYVLSMAATIWMAYGCICDLENMMLNSVKEFPWM